METPPLNLKKYRDFGQLITDTFVFIKQEHQLLIKVILTYVGPFVLITAFAGAWMQTGLFKSMDLNNATDPFGIFRDLGMKYFIYILATLVSSTMMMCTLYSYMFLYTRQGKDGFLPEDVWEMVKEKFFPVLGLILVVGFIVFFGIILCIVPGVYLAVVFTLVVASSVFENLSPGKAMERSMFLVKEDFWFALGIGFVMSLIAGMLGMIFLAPSSIMSMFLMINNIQGESSQTVTIIFLILTAIGTFCASILYGIPHITMSMFYLSQIEKKESPNLFDKIEQINKPNLE